jgi:hypothetical protein
VLPLDLLDSALDLVNVRSGRPKQGHLRRSISSAYYDAFDQLQSKRHQTDYDPDAMLYKSVVLANIAIVETVIREFLSVPLKHRRAFAAWVLFRKRN